MSDTIRLSKADVTLLVDKCTDGVLTAAEADSLAAALRQDDEGAQWILNELELAGLIAEAFSKTRVEDFVRGFCERLSAEDSPEALVTDTQRMLRVETDRSSAAPTKKRLADAFFIPGTSGAERARVPVGKRRPRYRALALAVLVAVTLVGMVSVLGRTGRTATLISASGNVVLIRDDGQLPARPGTRLKVGDTLLVPAMGSAAVAYDKTTVVHVAAHSEAEIADARTRHADGVRTKRLYMKRGSAIVDVGSAKRGRGLIVSTPHAGIETGVSRFTVSVTLSSTQLTVDMGQVTLARAVGGALRVLSKGDSIVVGEGDASAPEMEPERNKGENHDR